MSKHKFNSSMFEKIKDSLNKEKGNGGGGTYANIMKFPVGHTYTLRLIPNLEDPEKTFFKHYTHGWSSVSTGAYVSTLSLNTFGEPDPITDTFWRLIKSKDPAEKELGKMIRRKDQWLINVYVHDDPANPENNGTVKILKIGNQLKDIIDDALTGEGAEDFGSRIFDLTKSGANFKIKAESSGEYVTFKSSKFYNNPVIDLSDDEIDKIYESVHNLEELHPAKTYEEQKEMLDIHFYGKSSTSAPTQSTGAVPKPSAKVSTPVNDDDDDIPFTFEGKSSAKSESYDDTDAFLASLEE